MREFYYKDKNTNVAFRGMEPANDEDWPPFDFFRLGHAHHISQLFSDVLKVKSPFPIPHKIIDKFVLKETDEMISKQLAESKPNPKVHELLVNDKLKYNKQNKLLKGLTLTTSDILWLNKEAQDLGYLMDVYRQEKHPGRYDEKKSPVLFRQKKDGSIESFGQTDMSEGEMKALLEERKVVQARIYHKGEHWHCFYFTYRGLAGKEAGEQGAKPHYHYISDRSGISLEDLKKRIKDCDMPSSKVHVVIDRDG